MQLSTWSFKEDGNTIKKKVFILIFMKLNSRFACTVHTILKT